MQGRLWVKMPKQGDIVVNVTKSKKLTNMRASGGADDKAKIIPPVGFSFSKKLSNTLKKMNM